MKTNKIMTKSAQKHNFGSKDWRAGFGCIILCDRWTSCIEMVTDGPQT